MHLLSLLPCTSSGEFAPSQAVLPIRQAFDAPSHGAALLCLLISIMSIMAPAVAEGQDGARIWTHRGGTSVTGRLVDVRNQLVTILVGSKRVDVPYLELSEADRGVVNNWLRLQTTVVSSGRFRPTMRLHKQQGSDGGGSFKVYINNVLQTSAVTDVESEILVPFYYDASLLTYRILESGYGKTVSSKDIADTSKGKSTKFQPLPKDPYLKALDELEQVSAMAATVLTWDAGKLLSAESQARLSAVMSADENLRKLTIIQDIQNGSRKLDLKGDDWMPTVPRAANPGRIKLALTRLTELLGVISDPKAAVEFRHLRWKAVREELVLFLDLLRLCCMPEHPWWTTNKAFRANGEEVYIELRDGAIIHYARKVKDLRD